MTFRLGSATMEFSKRNQEGLSLLRFILVLSSISPLFVLWAVRGVAVIPDHYFVSVCLVLSVLPTLVLLLREKIARSHQDVRSLTVGRGEDHRGHVLVYLFAILLPFYRQDVESWRELSALVLALVFIVFLFWHLNFHYMNILFAIRGYNVFTVHPAQQDNEYANLESYVLITRRKSLPPGQLVVGLRLSNTIYLEKSS